MTKQKKHNKGTDMSKPQTIKIDDVVYHRKATAPEGCPEDHLPVLVFDQRSSGHATIFYGYLEKGVKPKYDKTIEVKNARQVFYYGKTGGITGLASKGPPSDSKIGPPAPTLMSSSIHAAMRPSDEAVAKFEAHPHWE